MERLYRFLNALGMDVEIVVKPVPKSRETATLRGHPGRCSFTRTAECEGLRGPLGEAVDERGRAAIVHFGSGGTNGVCSGDADWRH